MARQQLAPMIDLTQLTEPDEMVELLNEIVTEQRITNSLLLAAITKENEKQ
jgi:hypothetical protein